MGGGCKEKRNLLCGGGGGGDWIFSERTQQRKEARGSYVEVLIPSHIFFYYNYYFL